MGFPALMLRRSHERMEGEDLPLLIKSSIEDEDLIEKIEITMNLKNKLKHQHIRDYNNSNVSDQILMVILSHISTVNNFTWFKN